MSSLWPYGPVEFEVSGGDVSAIELKVPRRGTIKSLVIEQLDNGNDSGTIQLFDSRDAVLAYLGPGSESISEAGEETNAAMAHAVTPQLAIEGGQLTQLGQDYAYINRDGTNANPVRRLWGLLDIPDVAGSATFAISMLIQLGDFDS